MSVVSETYRTSHIGRGSDYHTKFDDNPRRRLIWGIEQRILDDILKRFLNARSIDYLDFACGTGRILNYLESRVTSAIGIDISPTMLQVARQNVQCSEIIEADLTQDAVLGERQFDLITAFRFFPNAEPALRALALNKLTNHLKPDGILVFNNHRSNGSLRSRLARVATWGRRGHGGMSPHEVLELVRSSDLTISKRYHAGIVPEFETFLLQPRFLVNALEQVGAALPLASIAQDVVYVCRHSN